MEKPFGFSDAVASDSIKRISSFFYCSRIKRQNIGAVDISAQYKKQNPDEITSAGSYFIFT